MNNENDHSMVGEDVFQDARPGNIPPQNNYKLLTPHDSNKISATESSRSGQHGYKKNTQSRGCDSPLSTNVSFRDIIGHGQAKLRLDEALLPLALPPDLAASVLTGLWLSIAIQYHLYLCHVAPLSHLFSCVIL